MSATTDPTTTSDELPESRIENGCFVNSFNPAFKLPNFFQILHWLATDTNNTRLPPRGELDQHLPIVRHEKLGELFQTSANLRFLWIGHASCLVQMKNFTFLTDPVFSDNCGATSFIGPKRFRPPALTVQELPDQLHAVLISHNHYDHLDLPSVKSLNERYGNKLKWFCGRGTAEWFHCSGIPKENVIELDWWQEYQDPEREVTIAFCPAQHWSRRGVFDINKCLWGGYAVYNSTHRFYFAGDTGYTHNIPIFKQIGKKYGPFDLSAIPIGAYEPRRIMEGQHVSPDEAVQIHIDVQSKKSIGVHWGTWALANEFYLEPPTKLADAVKNNKLDPSSFIVLQHGEIVDLPENN